MKLIKFFTVMILLFAGLLFISTKPAMAQDNGIPVLMYHHMLKKSENTQFKNNAAVINVEDFEQQMKFLKDNGYYTATVSELEAYLTGSLSLPSKTVVITFDDGHKSNYLYAYPTLKKYGFKATAFLISSRISEEPVPFDPDGLQFLSWPEINEMKDTFLFASHTHNLHYTVNGTAALISVPEADVLSDLETSRDLLNTDSLAYPFGSYNQSTIELLKTAGFKYAFTIVPKNAKKGDNLFEIGRIGIYPYTSMKEFQTLVQANPFKQGWVRSEGNWYYYDENGTMKTGWIKVKDIYFYLDQKGIMKTGWLKWNKNWYFLDNSGAMRTGWIQTGSTWYYLDASGKMITGWLKNQNDWYYLNSSGAMETGWKLVLNNWYYFYSSGKMAANTKIGGYKLSGSGALVR